MRTYNPKYISYFQVLIDEMREHHNFTRARRPKPKALYYSFPSGFTGIKYVAGFYSQGPYAGQKAYTELLINVGDTQTNKSFFDTLRERELEINAKFNEPLYWNRRDDLKQSWIYMDHDGNIESSASELETLRKCHIEHLLAFKEVFTPEIELAREMLQSC